MNSNKLLVRFVNEGNGWYPWDAMTDYEFDGGGAFPDIKEDWEIKTLWVRFDQDKADAILNTQTIGGNVIPGPVME